MRLTVLLLICLAPMANADETARTISVNGFGFAEVAPDRATLHMSIVVHRKTLSVAQNAAAKVSAKVLELADRLQIERDRVDTTGASVRPDYHWDSGRKEQVLKGYIATRQIVVDLRDLEKLGDVVEGAVTAGVNQVSPPRLGSGKRREVYRTALANAARDARANAEQLARSLGARLGPVLQINSSSGGPQPPLMSRMQNMAVRSDAGAAESYNAADLSFTANVDVMFTLESD